MKRIAKHLTVRIVVWVLLSYTPLHGCPTCVGRIAPDGAPFFTDSYYQTFDHEDTHAPSLLDDSDDFDDFYDNIDAEDEL